MANHSYPVALITGAARRIGAVTARILHEFGFNIAIHYHKSAAEAEALAKELNELRANSAVLLPADLTQVSAFPELLQSLIKVWGRLDLLINNASSFYPTAFGSVNEKQWDALLACNLKAPFFLAQAARVYLDQQKGASIINIADIHGERPMSNYSAYCISKAGLLMLTKALAEELGPRLRVNAISPGAVIWPENMLTEVKEKILKRTVLKRTGSPPDIAGAVLYLVQAHYVTGQTITVDGGRSLHI